MTNMTTSHSLPHVEPLEQSLRADLQRIIDLKTKPPGSLGQLETLARQMGMIQRTTQPSITRAAMIVFAADHGIAHAVAPHERLVDIPLGKGTRNFAQEPAMTRDEALAALRAGAERVRHHAALGTNVIGFGEMGIANTSSAACLMSRLCGVPIDECVGRGTGLDNAGLVKKRNVLAAALAKHAQVREPLDVLATFGGFEIAMMTGAFLEAARQRMAILVDGFIATSALLVADSLAPNVRD